LVGKGWKKKETKTKKLVGKAASEISSDKYSPEEWWLLLASPLALPEKAMKKLLPLPCVLTRSRMNFARCLARGVPGSRCSARIQLYASRARVSQQLWGEGR
jgi:hypothetical protein